MVCLGRPYHLKSFKGYFPQILLGPFFNTSSHLEYTDIPVENLYHLLEY